ncbi:AI-2E family transporter [Candidatus Woesearchaeota archaeon]|nr:AI-2E family transporter [Candidatus Woesearchaeota archaeon]
MKKKVSSQFFIIVLLAVLYLAARVVWPYMGYIVLSIVIAYATRPLYLLLKKWVKREWLAAGIMVLLVLIVLFIPSLFLMQSLVKQASSTIANVNNEMLEGMSGYVSDRFNIEFDAAEIVTAGVKNIRDFLLNESFNVISGIADILIGVIIMFFVLFYLFRDGKEFYDTIVDILPLAKNHKKVLFGEMELITNAVIYGQLVIALIQGIAGGVAFVIFGLSNAVFWGFIIAIVSFLPIVGTPIIFIPAGIVQIAQHNYVGGIGIIVFSVILTTNVDSIVKPLIISERSRLNAALILIGVIGGLKVFGFMGFVIGPLVLALLFALLQVFRQDFKPSAELVETQRNPKEHMIIKLHERPPDDHRVASDEKGMAEAVKKKGAKKEQ